MKQYSLSELERLHNNCRVYLISYQKQYLIYLNSHNTTYLSVYHPMIEGQYIADNK